MSLARFERRDYAAALLPILLGGIAYSQVGGFGFVNFDDNVYLYENPHTLGGLGWDNLVWAFTQLHANNWHPLTWISLQLDVALFGVNPGAHHWVNVGIHLAATALLQVVLRLGGASRGMAFWVALLFALHPVHVESVAWISERKDVLSAFFGIATIGFYMLWRQHGRTRYYAALLICFGLGLLSKPMLVTLPFLLPLLDLWPLRRVRFDAADLLREAKGALLPLAPLIAMTLLVLGLTLLAQDTAMVDSAIITLPMRIVNAFSACLLYIQSFLWPVGLVPYRPLSVEPPWTGALAGAAVLAAAFAWAVPAARRGNPAPLVGLLWWLGMLVPVIGLVQVGTQAMADRYLYLPGIGLSIVLIEAAAPIARRMRSEVRWVAGTAVAVILTLLTFMQSSIWRNSITLWSHNLRNTPPNYPTFVNLGAAHLELGNLDEAERLFEAAAEGGPAGRLHFAALGQIYARKQDFPRAKLMYQQAAIQAPDDEWVRKMLVQVEIDLAKTKREPPADSTSPQGGGQTNGQASPP